jgi:hypothetical protein
MFDDAFAFQLPETESISKFYYGKLHHSVMFNSKKLSRQAIKDIEDDGMRSLPQMLSKGNVIQMCPSTH